uniref:EF-hand domain-containing protein n=1 Tax=Romanomermis culicivorax TaxID=13658 RepID=A0A915K8T6_ROMCU
MLNIEDTSVAEIEKSLIEIKRGIFLQRIRKGCLDDPSNVLLTEDEDFLIYENRKKSKYRFDGDKRLPISEILEIRSGWRTDNFQKLSSNPKFCNNILESRCFSIIFRHPIFLIKSLDFVAQTIEMQDYFVNGLRYLINKIRKEIHCFNEEKWLKEQFIKADKNKNGTLSFKEVWNLLSYLNLELDEKQAKRLFELADFRKNNQLFGEESLDFDEFLVFFRSLTQRTELKSIMCGYSRNKKEYFTIEDLKNFVENVQKRPVISDEECEQILDIFEPELPNKIAKILSVTGYFSVKNCTE